MLKYDSISLYTLRTARTMTYVVDERCIKCKTTDCVAVCPVNCFYEGENMLVIHPDECIDCGVCEPECPVDAIKPDSEPGVEKWLVLNREYAQKWPNIMAKKDMPKDARARPSCRSARWYGHRSERVALRRGGDPRSLRKPRVLRSPRDQGIWCQALEHRSATALRASHAGALSRWRCSETQGPSGARTVQSG